jgi:hypothetical protein
MTKKSFEGLCEMCGNYVSIRQKAHIIAEDKKIKENVLMLCPNCHLMFDTQIKPKVFMALKKRGLKLPPSWEKSIYDQTCNQTDEASRKATKKKKKRNKSS